MRLKCGFVLRGILLICLLYSIYIITQDDDFKQAAQKLEGKHSPIENNHQNNHEQAPPGPLKSPESNVKHSKNRFGDLPIPIHKIEDGEEIDFNAPNFQHSDFRDPSIKHDDGIQEAKAYDDFGAVKEPVQALLPKNALKDDTLVKNSIKNSNEHYKQQNVGQIDLSGDPYAGTVQSKKYLNPSIPAAYYDSTKLGNYEVEDPCKGYVKKSNDGECGIPVTLDGEEQKLVPAIIKKFGFNLISGDKVPLDRNPKDLRKPACKNWHYPEKAKLPSASVILVFYNEGWGPLMRTVHTVIKQSPPELLGSIILLDDGSPRSHLHERLENYIKENWGENGLVRLFRNSRREGLIRARINGAKHAQNLPGDVLVFLDAHCEPQPNWLPPLLEPIARDKRMSTVPLIDSISGQDYSFSPQGGGDQNGHARGAWDWSMLWKRIPVDQREARKHKQITEPYGSPAMAGGLFAIDKNYFRDIGYYDPGLEIWGGENFEISYKIWMCGGQVLFVPCSRVGHIYRLTGWDGNPPPEYVPSNPSLRNYMRVVEVWWDEYKEYFYTTRPETIGLDFGDISPQQKFRTDNKCKSFDWFMKEIAYDVIERFPIPPLNLYWGELRGKGSNQCMDGMGRKNGDGEIAQYSCHKMGGNQLFRLTEGFQLAQYDSCVTTFPKTRKAKPGHKLSVYQCSQSEYKDWKWVPEESAIVHSPSSLCLTRSLSGSAITLETCDKELTNQQWEFNEVHNA